MAMTCQNEKQVQADQNEVHSDEQASHGLDLGLKPKNIFEYDIVKRLANLTFSGKAASKAIEGSNYSEQ